MYINAPSLYIFTFNFTFVPFQAVKSDLTQTKITPLRLPAYKRFAHLVHETKSCDLTFDQPLGKAVTTSSAVNLKPILPIVSSPAKALFQTQSPLSSPQKPYQPASEVLRSHIDHGKTGVVLPPPLVVTPSKALYRPAVKLFSPRTTPVKAVQLASPVCKSKENVEAELSACLALPFHMQALFELFRACDQVVSTLHNRSEVCSFDKLRPAVQEIVRR